MPVSIIDNFSVNVSKPIDTRIIASNSTVRLAIAYKYDGLKVFQLDNRNTYIWNSGTSTWDLGLFGIGATGYMPYYVTDTQLAPSAFYQAVGYNIGLNTNDPKSNFQISGTFVGAVQPLSLNVGSVDAEFTYNYYNDGSDQVFDGTKGSSRISFDDNGITFRVRNINDLSSSFYTPLYLNSGTINVSSTDYITVLGNTVSTKSISLLVLAPTQSVGGQFYTTYGLGVHSTFSITALSNDTTQATDISIYGGSSNLGSNPNGSKIRVVGGDATGFFTNGYGGSVSVIGGYGNAIFGNGYGGDVRITGGDGSYVGGNIYIVAGSNGSLRGGINLGVNRLLLEDSDFYAFVHNTGTNGIGNSGNSTTPWSYPSIASGQFSMSPADVSDITNLTSVVPGPAAWIRVGNVVSVSGQVSFSVTTGAVASTFKLKVPISSDFGNDLGSGNANNWQLNGTAKVVGVYGGGDVASIQAFDNSSHSATSSRAHFRFQPSTSGSKIMTYHYQYIVGIYPDTPAGPPSPPTP